MTVYASTGAFTTRSLPEIVGQCRDWGIPALELSSGAEHMPGFDAYVAELEASGLELAVHNYFPAPEVPFVLNLGAVDPETLAKSRAHVSACIKLAARLGAPYYSVHSAFVLTLTADVLGKPELQAELAARNGLPDRQLVHATFVESLKLLAAEAQAHGIGLLVENNVVSAHYLATQKTDPFLMTRAEDIEALLAEVGSDALGILVDVAHAKVSAHALGFDAGDWLKRLVPLARCLHLSDNDGLHDSNQPFGPDAWFWPLLKDCRADAVVEVYRLERAVLLSQLELARRMLGQ